jgi:hypothetical protein
MAGLETALWSEEALMNISFAVRFASITLLLHDVALMDFKLTGVRLSPLPGKTQR